MGVMVVTSSSNDSEDDIVRRLYVEDADRLLRALRARYGVEVGTEASADMWAWAWQHRCDVAAAKNPRGLLFRVGQSVARPHLRHRRVRPWWPILQAESSAAESTWDDELLHGLAALKPIERTAVLLHHGYDFTYQEVAELLEIKETAVTNHIHRGMVKLRRKVRES